MFVVQCCSTCPEPGKSDVCADSTLIILPDSPHSIAGSPRADCIVLHRISHLKSTHEQMWSRRSYLVTKRAGSTRSWGNNPYVLSDVVGAKLYDFAWPDPITATVSMIHLRGEETTTSSGRCRQTGPQLDAVLPNRVHNPELDVGHQKGLRGTGQMKASSLHALMLGLVG